MILFQLDANIFMLSFQYNKINFVWPTSPHLSSSIIASAFAFAFTRCEHGFILHYDSVYGYVRVVRGQIAINIHILIESV